MSVRSFLDAAEQRIDALHSFLLLRHGELIAEGHWHPWGADRPHRMFSLSKSFTATAIGFAVAEGRLTLDDPVGADPRMRVRHLLTMTTGHDVDPTQEVVEAHDWAAAFRALPVEHEPGTHFVYNSAATYMLSAILQETTGESLVEYLRPRLFDPLGVGPVEWETCPRGVNTGGWGLSIRPADVAAFGQLHLDDPKGILPPGWAAQATAAQVDNAAAGDSPDWQQGYGYQFWRCRHGAFRGDGAFGQFCVVMPEQGQVVAITAGVADMQAVLDLVWEHLLHDTTTPDPETTQRLKALALPALKSTSPGRIIGTFTVAHPRRTRSRDRFPSHERPPSISAVTFEPSLVRVDDEAGTHEYRCEEGEWHVNGAVASTGAWTAPDTFTFRLAWVRTPFLRTYVCTFAGGAGQAGDAPDAVTIRATDNVSFGPIAHPAIHATR